MIASLSASVGVAFPSQAKRDRQPQRTEHEPGSLQPMQADANAEQCQKHRSSQTIEHPPIGRVHRQNLTTFGQSGQRGGNFSI